MAQDTGAQGGAAAGGPGRVPAPDELEALASTGFDKVIGLQYVEASGDRVHAEWDVRPELHQPYGIVHGGVYCAVIESLASVGGALWLGERGNVVGVNNNTNFLRAVRSGRLTAVAEPQHRGRLQQLWRVTITAEDGRLAAEGQVRLQNIEDSHRLGN